LDLDQGSIRLDKWLWQARFFKSRSLSHKLVMRGHVRLNAQTVSKPSTAVRVGDVLAFSQARQARIVRVTALGTRRGPAPEARRLYEDMSPPTQPPSGENNPRFDGGGRPSKKDRRAAHKFEPRA